MKNTRKDVLKIVAIYVIAGSLWICTSDWLLGVMTSNPALLNSIVMAKGLIFIAVTGFFLYILIKRDLLNLQKAYELLGKNEIQLRAIYENSRIPIIVMDATTLRYIDCNPAALQIYRMNSRAEVLGKTPDDFSTVLQYDGTSSAVKVSFYVNKAKAEGSIVFEWRHQRPDGEIWDAEVHLMSYQSAEQELLQFTLQDITERKQAEENLAQIQVLLEQTMEQSPIPMVLVSMPDAVIRIVNHACREFLGIEDEPSPKDTKLFDLKPTWTDYDLADRPGKLEDLPLVRALQGQSTFNEERKIVRKDGTVRWELVSGVPIYNSKGELAAGFLVMNDISERKIAENLLKQSEEKFRAAFTTSPDSININRLSDGVYVSINQGFTSIMGYSEADAIGKSSLDLNIWVDPEDRHKLVTGLRKFGKVENLEARFRAKDGTFRIGLMSAAQIPLANEPHILSITRDITEVKRLQAELFQSQKMRSVGTLAGGIAHDFNNILHIILGYTSILENKRDDPARFSEIITIITQAVDRGTALVRQILTFARKTDVSFKPVFIPDVVHDLLSMLKQTFPKTIKLQEDIEANFPLILADQSQIHQILLNLCVNARDAMPQGGILTIKLWTCSQEQMKEHFAGAEAKQYAAMSISDNGVGMDETTRSRIFDPFFTTKEIGKGTGLGLAVVYGIVQDHQGFIHVHSILGQGTTFNIYFPIHALAQPSYREFSDEKTPELKGSETILLVEDEAFLLEMLVLTLEAQGYNILQAEDGKKAIEIYQQHREKIRLVISDMGLPEMSGKEEFLKLKEIDPEVKVIFASGFFDPEIRAYLAEAGAKGFIQKPYRPSEMVGFIRKILDEATLS
jgi:PAS domain S-box-containing protein